MSLSIEQLQRNITAPFSDVRQLNSSIVSFTRKVGDSPFAVYYIDLSQDLPKTKELLTEYQDQVIGTNYFTGNKSLQWNNYLYFLTAKDYLSNEEAHEAKILIESDSNYARKFVIPEDELDSVLYPPRVIPASVASKANILLIWTESLSKAGIDKAIFSDDFLPDRLKLIEEPSTEETRSPRRQTRREPMKSPSFIRSLNINKFREYPLQRQFNFGKVNLIFGVNATGKTSLLEAIELFYCGRNKRDPDEQYQYEIEVNFADGSTEMAKLGRDLQIFRERNLKWYGQSEIKTNYLYQSFAQYNFLDTDAAVSLSSEYNAGSKLEEDLSKLLVGPDAAKTWFDINNVNRSVAARVDEFREEENQIEMELNSIEDQTKKISEVKQESDIIHTHLGEMLHRMGWTSPQEDKQEFASSLIGSLTELISVIQQALEMNLSNLPLSFDILEKQFSEIEIITENAEPDIIRLETLENNLIRLKNAIDRDREAADLVKQSKRLIVAGIPRRIEEQNTESNIISTYSNYLAGINDDYIKMLSAESITSHVKEYQQSTITRLSESEALLENTRSEYANFNNLREESINLARELRQIAEKIIQSSPNLDECPLCHTQFEPGKLNEHIHMDVNDPHEEVGQLLLQRLWEMEEEVKNVTTLKEASSWLNDFCVAINLSTDIPVHLALTEVENAKRTLVDAQNRFESVNTELISLETQGLSLTKLEDCYTRLAELGYDFKESSLESAEQIDLTIEQNLAISTTTLDDERKQVDKLKQKLATTLGLVDPGIEDLQAKLKQLKGRLVEIELIKEKLEIFRESFPWPKERQLGEIVIEAESIRKVAAELQSGLCSEEQAQLTNIELSERKTHLEQQVNPLRSKLEHLQKAQSVLNNIIEENSLEEAMKSAIQENRSEIENIFTHIHSPTEFSGLGSSLTTLIRKVDGSESNLRNISAGQRTAFALSIFLAKNSQQATAPPIILVDDPIAHVDDLNALSFLDYLREIAIAGEKQIFFTTANEKLASLFERKFDFLGSEDFCRINLNRDVFSQISSGE